MLVTLREGNTAVIRQVYALRSTTPTALSAAWFREAATRNAVV